MSVTDVLLQVCAGAITAGVFVLRNAVFLVQVAHANFPQVTQVVVGLVLIYVIYKLAVRLVRLWIGLLISVVKMTLVFAFMVLCLAIYVRGFSRFVNQDIGFIAGLFNNPSEWENRLSQYSFLSKLAEWGNNSFSYSYSGFKSAEYDFPVEVDAEYLDYVRDNFDNIKDKIDPDLIKDTWDNVNEYIANQNIDVNQVGNNIYNYLRAHN